MKKRICLICVGVSSAWFFLSVLAVWGFVQPEKILLPIALLMGGSVVGIAYSGEKRCSWAARHPLLWKSLEIGGGMPLAYALIVNLSKEVVVLELLILLVISYFFFFKQPSKMAAAPQSLSNDGSQVSNIEEKLQDCC